jgi:hypothetical protein
MHAAEVRLPPTYPLGGATASMELPPDAQQHALRSGLSLTDLVAYLRQASPPATSAQPREAVGQPQLLIT